MFNGNTDRSDLVLGATVLKRRKKKAPQPRRVNDPLKNFFQTTYVRLRAQGFTADIVDFKSFVETLPLWGMLPSLITLHSQFNLELEKGTCNILKGIAF